MRILGAFRYSLKGLAAAFTHEAAFRQELALTVAGVIAACWVGRNLTEVAVLIAPLVLMLIVELLNSAIEAIADAISLDHHPLLGRAKDLGSAAVLLSMLLLAGVWAVVIARHLFS